MALGTFVSSATGTPANGSTTFSFGNFNMPTGGKLVAVITTSGTLSPLLTSVSIGGTNGTLDVNSTFAGISHRDGVGSGNQNVTATWASSLGNTIGLRCSVWCLVGAASDNPADTDTNTNTSTSITNTIDIPDPSGFAVFGVVTGNNAGISWSGGGQVADGTVNTLRHSAAQYAVVGNAHVETATHTGSVFNRMVSASWASTIVTLTAAQGSYALNGKAAASKTSMPAAQGSYTLTGKTVALIPRTILTAATGFYTVTGKAISTIVRMAVAYGIYALNGQSAASNVRIRMKADTGYYTVSRGWHSPSNDIPSPETNKRVNNKWWAKLLNGGN